MKNLLLEMLASAAIATLLYYGLALTVVPDTRWAAAIAAGAAIAIIAIGRRVLRRQKQL
jgi:membrane protein implicated in regulation of membrane protease activity